jgi:hypothetical protein
MTRRVRPHLRLLPVEGSRAVAAQSAYQDHAGAGRIARPSRRRVPAFVLLAGCVGDAATMRRADAPSSGAAMIRSVQARIDGGSVGRLEDGTAYFAPLGQLLWDPEDDRVKCHLCGGWFRFLGSSHLLRTHGWTLARYREAFQLRGNVPTCSEQLSAAHRANAQRRIDADQFGARYLPPAGARRAPVVPRWRSLAVRHPELVEQLHPKRNGQIDPLEIAAGSNQKLWWRCAAGHEWQATVHNRPRDGAAPSVPPPRTCGGCACWREPRLACRRSARWRPSGPSLWLSFTRRATVVLTLRRSDTARGASCGGAVRAADTNGARRSQAARSGAPAAGAAPWNATRSSSPSAIVSVPRLSRSSAPSACVVPTWWLSFTQTLTARSTRTRSAQARIAGYGGGVPPGISGRRRSTPATEGVDVPPASVDNPVSWRTSWRTSRRRARERRARRLSGWALDVHQNGTARHTGRRQRAHPPLAPIEEMAVRGDLDWVEE